MSEPNGTDNGATRRNIARGVRLLAIVAATFAGLPAARADELPVDQWSQPRLHFEGISYGVMPLHGSDQWVGAQVYSWTSTHAISFRFDWRRWRFGVAYYQDNQWQRAYWFLPVTVGYTIYRRPVPLCWRIEGALPEVAAELTAWWADVYDENENVRTLMAGRAGLAAETHLLGLGLGLHSGVAAALTSTRHWQAPATRSLGFTPYVEVRGAAAATSFNLGRRVAPAGPAAARPDRASWFIEATLLDGGIDAEWWKSDNSRQRSWPAPATSFVDVGARWWRVRCGVTLVDVSGGLNYGASFLQPRIAFTLLERARGYGGRLHGRVPEVYVQAKYQWAIWNDPPPYIHAVRTEIGARADYFGVGLAASAGVTVAHRETHGLGSTTSLIPFVGVRAALATFSAGF